MQTSDVLLSGDVLPPSVQPEQVEVIEDDGIQAQGMLPDILRQGANGLSLVRAVGGVALGFQIGASEYPAESMAPTMIAGALAFTDFLDGWLARKATALDGKKPSRFGAWVDQLTDKVFVGALIAGIACGSIANERTAAGVAVAAAGGAILIRDAYVTYKRIQVEKSGLNISTGAKWHGKAKTAAQFAALLALTSPAMESQPASWAAIGLLGASAGAAVLSALEYRKSFNDAMSVAEAPEQ